MLKKLFYGIIAAVFLYFIDDYMNGCEYESDVRLDGKVVIVTGANTGIGKETVKDLVKRGGKIYMACRSLQRGQTALDDIKQETGASDNNLVLLQLDLSSLASVRQFVAEFKKREHRLDILINNAGVMWVPYGQTVHGYETTFATNHLGHFLLTHLLVDLLVTSAPSRVITVSCRSQEHGSMQFDHLMTRRHYDRILAYANSKLANVIFAGELARRLKGPFLLTNLLADILLASAPSRVVNVASKAHERGSIVFNDLMAESSYSLLFSYSQSKLANVLFAWELARRLEGTGVTSYSLHPGAIVTELGRHAPIINLPVIRDVAYFLLKPLLKDAYHGARTQVYLAVEPGVEADNGKYFSDCSVKEPIAEATNAEIAKKLWTVSIDLVKLDSDEIHPKLRN